MSCSIVPLHVYNNIVEKGSIEQKTLAAQVIETIKGFRSNKEEFIKDFVKTVCAAANSKEAKVNRTVHDAEEKMKLPGKVVRKESDKSNKDVAVDEAYEGSGKTFELFQKAFGRNSIDDKGMELVSTVHFGRKFANAFWNSSQIVFGDGDGGKFFNRFTAVIDVIGHEISHGVIERTAGLVYYAQSGALNESFADVFGSLIKQYSLGQTAEQADWLIGAGLFTDRVEGEALRNMAKPGTAFDDEVLGSDSQPDHMDRYVKTESDNAGVHINSGIPNKAFYHSAMNIGGFAWEKAGKIWYNTLCRELNKNSQFQECADATVKVAGELYGSGSTEQKAVIDGWREVGIKTNLLSKAA